MSEYIIRETGYPGTLKQEIVGELVRCKECKHSYIEADGRRCCSTILDDRSTTDDWFCKGGERKDDEWGKNKS